MTKICKLIVHDQCNASFIGLDPTTRRACNKELKYFIHAARHTPAYKLGRWDGCVSFFAINGNTFVNVIERVLPIIVNANYDIELDDQRPDNFFEFDEVSETYFTERFNGLVWPAPHTAAGQPIILRDYQVDVIRCALENLQSVQEISTGSGKTLICAALSHLCEDYGKTIIIVPNRDLVNQTEADYRNIGLDVGVYYGGRKEFGHKHMICTWQSLSVLEKSITALTISQFVSDVVCVICDECVAPGTLIQTKFGSIPIERINVGDKIISFNEETRNFEEDIVVKTHINLNLSSLEDMFEIIMDNGSSIQITGNHKVLTTFGWKQVKDLTIDDNILNWD